MVHPVDASFLKSTALFFLHGYKNPMRNDYFYRDLDCFLDTYVQT